MVSLYQACMSDEETDPDMHGQLLLRSRTLCPSKVNNLIATIDQEEEGLLWHQCTHKAALTQPIASVTETLGVYLGNAKKPSPIAQDKLHWCCLRVLPASENNTKFLHHLRSRWS